MEYDLNRIDYTICGITYPDTLKILPAPGPKNQQKFVIGDKTGVLHCLMIKDEEPVVQFKTLPGKPITSLQLASTSGNQSDKIFAASGNEVKGYTRKGKVFLSIETAVSETITSVSVLDSDLILCSGRTVTYYRELKEIHSYICEDRVLDIASFSAPNSLRIRLLVLIANKGAAILENGQMIAKTPVSSGPCRLAVPPLLHSSDIYTYYGAADGSIGILYYNESKLASKCLVEGKELGAVVCTGWYFSNSATHLAVGRHDGSIQLYLVDMDNINEKPRLKFTYFCGEPVTSVAGGCIATEESELLVATFSGRIFGLRASRLIPGNIALANVPADVLNSRRIKLQAEVARLEKQTANEREKYQKTTRSLHAALSTPPLLDIEYELTGADKEGWQEVRIISAVPLDMLFVYCTRKLDILTDSATVLSICSTEANDPSCLATIRCQAGTRRLWVKIRFSMIETYKEEGAKVFIYFLPSGSPRVARLITIKLPALPQYSQHEDMDASYEKRCCCEVTASGSFSVAEVTSWLSDILPGELPRPAAMVTFIRRHTLLGTLLICRYQRGSAVFKSDNVSTVATIRNVISNRSVQKGIRVEITCDIPDDCCLKSFEKIEDQYMKEHNKYKDAKLKKAIGALDIVDENNGEIPILCAEYMRVWNTPMESLENYFEELVDTIKQWYLDWKALSFHVTDHSHQNVKLEQALQNGTIDVIRSIFSANIISNETNIMLRPTSSSYIKT